MNEQQRMRFRIETIAQQFTPVIVILKNALNSPEVLSIQTKLPRNSICNLRTMKMLTFSDSSENNA